MAPANATIINVFMFFLLIDYVSCGRARSPQQASTVRARSDPSLRRHTQEQRVLS
jgi:hypothetical protein